MAASAWARRLAEVPLIKKRPTRGWRKEWKTIWAPLCWISTDRKVASDKLDSLGLGKGHPEDKDELEGVVKGWSKVSGLFCRSLIRCTYGTSKRR